MFGIIQFTQHPFFCSEKTKAWENLVNCSKLAEPSFNNLFSPLVWFIYHCHFPTGVSELILSFCKSEQIDIN